MAVGRSGLDQVLFAGGRSPDELLELDDPLERLAAANPAQRRRSSSASARG
jgi:hypothetical protein